MTSISPSQLPQDSSLVRRLAAAIVSPGVADFWLQQLHPAWSWDRPLAQVVERRLESRNSVTLVLKPNRHWRRLGGFQAGQHVNVTAEVGGVRVTRSYSLSDAPRPDGRLAITVQQVESGKLSTHLCRHTRVGDVLELGPAFGAMTLPERMDGHWLFLAAGSGITPVMSLLRALSAQCPMAVRSITVAYWAKRSDDMCFTGELKAMARRLPGMNLHLVATRETGLSASAQAGARLSRDTFEILGIPHLSEQQVYACGPAGFVDTARELAKGQARLFQGESFSPWLGQPNGAGTVSVHLRASGRTLELPVGQPLLAALEAQGVHPPSGCRMGICHTCVCHKVDGITQDLTNGELATEPAAALRLCVSAPRSPLTLDL